MTSSYLKRQKERQIAFQEERYQRYYPTRNFTISPDLRTNIYGVNLDGSDKPDNHQITERQAYHRDDTDASGIEHRDIRHLNMLLPRLRHVGIVVAGTGIVHIWDTPDDYSTLKHSHIFTEQESVSDQCRN